MIELRLYFLVRRDVGSYDVRVPSVLEEALEYWANLPADHQYTGIIHFGYSRPTPSSFETVASQFPSMVLYSESAKYEVPPEFISSNLPVGTADDIPVYLALNNWGYEIDDIPSGLPAWLEGYCTVNPLDATAIHDLGIVDNESYYAIEGSLPTRVRHSLGIAWFRAHLDPTHDSGDPCKIASASPPWFKQIALTDIPIGRRIVNALSKRGINYVGDLSGMAMEDLLNIRGLGEQSVFELTNQMYVQMTYAIPDTEPSNQAAEESEPLSLSDAMQEFLSSLSERERLIVNNRFGLGTEPATLQEVALDLGVTRERVRQLEKATINELKSHRICDLTKTRFDQALSQATFPLPIDGLESIDTWFTGLRSYGPGLLELFRKATDSPIQALEIDGIHYLGRLNQEDWDQAVNTSQEMLRENSDRGWSENQAKGIVEMVLDEAAHEFRDMLWFHASKNCHFAQPEGEQDRVLVAYGRGAEPAVFRALYESDKPLHFSNITEILIQRYGRETDIRRTHNAAANVGILLGRGTYGLRKHIPMTDEQLAEIRETSEEIISDGPVHRQWHASEIAEELIDEIPLIQHLPSAQYVISFALRESDILHSFRRLVWGMKPEGNESPSERIDREQAVIAILEQAGSPLTHSQIRDRLNKIRGIGKYFQIFPTDRIVKVGRKKWGLKDRDIRLSISNRNDLLDALYKQMSERQSGFHISELDPFCKQFALPSSDGPEIIRSIVSSDSRFARGLGGYIYLASWDGPRRQTILDGVRDALLTYKRPLTHTEILRHVEQVTGRTGLYMSVSSAIQNVDASYNPVNGTWTISDETVDE